jgi:Fe2+ transport system protein FeoA
LHSFLICFSKTLKNMINLSELGRGEKAVITGVHGSDGLRYRLQAMGLRSGREAEVIRCPRLGPMQIRIGSINLIMRRRDAARVSISI